VIAELRDEERISLDLVHDAVLLIDPARPPPGKGVSQRFRLPGPAVGIAADLPKESVDPLEDPLVGFLPVKVILPGLS
jgi:hypothetical protein